jgi:hypothetical protein
MVTIHDFMPTFEMLICCNPTFERAPFIKVPTNAQNHQCEDIFSCQASILKNP